MNIENNPAVLNPGSPQPLNQTYVQTPTPNSSPIGVWILAILLLFTILAFGAYVYYDQVQQKTSGNSGVVETTLVPTRTPTAIVTDTSTPSVIPSAMENYESISVDIPGVDNTVRYTKYSLSKPMSAKWSVKVDNKSYTESNSGFLEGENFSLIIKGEYEDESYGGTSYLAGYKLVKNKNYGNFYRVQTTNVIDERGNDSYFYVSGTNFVSDGACESIYAHLDPMPAPCGDSMLNIPEVALLSIYCVADDTNGLNECDKVVGSLKKV